jgi:hypothetical protein
VFFRGGQGAPSWNYRPKSTGVHDPTEISVPVGVAVIQVPGIRDIVPRQRFACAFATQAGAVDVDLVESPLRADGKPRECNQDVST